MRREALDGVELDPIGFKIGLEVIAKAHYGRALEIPYVFTDRVAGQSKLNEREIFNYLKQLTQLYATVAVAAREGAQSLMPMPDWLRAGAEKKRSRRPTRRCGASARSAAKCSIAAI